MTIIGKIELDETIGKANRSIKYCPKCNSSYSFGICSCELDEELAYLESITEIELSEEDLWDGDESENFLQ